MEVGEKGVEWEEGRSKRCERGKCDVMMKFTPGVDRFPLMTHVLACEIGPDFVSLLQEPPAHLPPLSL
jgi:hypothetical protein